MLAGAKLVEGSTARGQAGGGAAQNEVGPVPSGRAYFVTDEQPRNLQLFMDGILDGLGKRGLTGIFFFRRWTADA